MNANILQFVHEQLGNKTKLPTFKAGDTVTAFSSSKVL